MAKRKDKNKKIKRQLQQIADTDWVQDYCKYLDQNNFVKSCMGPTIYWDQVKDYDPIEILYFCKEHDLHSYEDVVKFAMEHTNWSVNAIL